MIFQTYFIAFLGFLILPSDDYQALKAFQIPDQVQVLNTNITITPAGKEKINEKLSSLTRNQGYYSDHLNRCLSYFPVIEREFAEAGVPTDFKYLSLQESTLDGNAVSRSQAVGYWQFKEATAQEYQLRVDNQIDERRNIISASRAAAQYFKKSNHYLNNWVYSMLSYNLGLTGAKNYIAENNLSNNVVVDGNTHQYIVHFLAHYFAFKDQYETRKNGAPVYLLEYAGGIQNNLQEIAQFALGPQGQDPSQLNSYVVSLREYNPWLMTERVPQNSAYCFSVVLPVNPQARQEMVSKMKPYACGGKVRGHNGREFYADSIKNDYPFIVDKKEYVDSDTYREVLANGVMAIIPQKEIKTKKVLRQLGLSQDDFQRFNEGEKYSTLNPGVLYYIQEKPEAIPVSYHIVEGEETMFDLAQKYGIRMDKLYQYNELDKDYELQPGDKIRFNPVE